MDLSSTERDFYERKINRLETSINSLEDELAATKIRLRTAEDFQIKYDLLLRQSQQDTLRLNGL